MIARQGTLFSPGTRFQVSGWIASLCLHSAVLFLAGLLAARMSLAPPASDFRWDVSVREAQSRPLPSPQPSSAVPSTVHSRAAVPPAHREKTPVAPATPAPSPPQAAALTPEAAPVDFRAIVPSLQDPEPEASRQLAEPLTPLPPTEISTQTTEPDVRLLLEQAPTTLPVEQAPPLSESIQTERVPAPNPLSDDTATPDADSKQEPEPTQVALAPTSPSPNAAVTKPDLSWLQDTLMRRIESFIQYPAEARLNHMEGRVLVRLVIEGTGHIVSVAIAKSSGYPVLDQAALDTLRRASPILLSQPLPKSSVTIQIPLRYRLDR